ncbi:beta subunit of citrate lyase [Fomitiporia mediterranea MF3/22]|uniref:beta subunit of citrate lyase n=1 Tax=Fomitiporia mediterranea (strain MF3/22) TaxID=694068 RepID=UPI0004408C74|nr:beta subunit of citrate lyase [Fomitiporia mediterranea MF3/22]EJC97995.1 beta subunit of citrate lyase [Fomitiporia mediterranea MF3/22]
MLFARATYVASIIRRRSLPFIQQVRNVSQSSEFKDLDGDRPRRSYLYVPCSSERMLNKSLETPSDVIIYDLEDSVAPDAKAGARTALGKFFNTRHEPPLPLSSRVAVRLNAVDTPYFEEDVRAAVSIPHVRTLVLPKIHSAEHLDDVAELVSWASSSATPQPRTQPLRLVASIESARGLWNIGHIAEWKSHNGPTGGVLRALLFAAEDCTSSPSSSYPSTNPLTIPPTTVCADTSIIRTPSRLELLHTRSQIVLAAKAFQLEAIDMVCVNYKDPSYLLDECQDGRRLGFTGKQAIHPAQVETIQKTFVPTEKEILRAARIVSAMQASHLEGRGAFGLDLSDGSGSREMIDAPMLKQAENVLRVAKAAGLEIPEV